MSVTLNKAVKKKKKHLVKHMGKGQKFYKGNLFDCLVENPKQ